MVSHEVELLVVLAGCRYLREVQALNELECVEVYCDLLPHIAEVLFPSNSVSRDQGELIEDLDSLLYDCADLLVQLFFRWLVINHSALRLHYTCLLHLSGYQLLEHICCLVYLY